MTDWIALPIKDPLVRVTMISKALVVGIYQQKCEALARRGIDLHVIVPTAWKDERGEMPLERAYTRGYRLDVLPLARNGDFHTHWYRGLGRALRDFRPDIVHIDEEPYNLSAWQMQRHANQIGARTIVFSWQNIVRRYPPPFAWGERWMLGQIGALIAGTQSAADVWREKGWRGTTHVIAQFGTDTDLFRPATGARPDRPFTVGYFGRLVEEKGLHVLLDAFAQVQGEWRLLLLGGGPLRAELHAQADRLGIAERVTFREQVASTQMAAHYHQIDVLALPSLTRPNWKEQFGRVLVEAMASGVPVVGSDSGAIPGVIGDGGLVVPEGDADALASALTRLRDEPGLAATLAARGRERVIMHYTHEGIAAQTADAYTQLMHSP